MGAGAGGAPATSLASTERKDETAVAQAPAVVDTQALPNLKKVGVSIKEKEPKQWNTKNLSFRLAVDAASAATAGGLVAPIITVIDKYVCPTFGVVQR